MPLIPEPPNGAVVVLHYTANNYDCYEVITRDDTTEGAHGKRRWRHADDRPEMPRAWAEWCADADTIHTLGPKLTDRQSMPADEWVEACGAWTSAHQRGDCPCGKKAEP